MLHKLIEYKNDRISDCIILKVTGVIMKIRNDLTWLLLLHLLNNHSKFSWQQ